jgi:hypothetical protein
MAHKHEHLIRAIFRDPASGNIHWPDVESLLHRLRATVEPLSGARVRVRLNGVEGILHRLHHGNVLDRQGIHHVRDYLGYHDCMSTNASVLMRALGPPGPCVVQLFDEACS